MHASSVRDVVYSQCCLFFCWAVCIALEPRFLFERNEGGMSNFGVHARTVLPYTLAFLVPALLIGRAARTMEGGDRLSRRFRVMLTALSCLLLAVLASTYFYKANIALRDLHIAVAIMTFCFETAASVWIVVSVTGRVADRILLGVQAAGFLLAALTFAGVLHVLFISQLVTSAAFGILLIRAMLELERRSDGVPPRPKR